jgi:zinc protease
MNSLRRLCCVALFSVIPALAGEEITPDRSIPPRPEHARRFTVPALLEDRLPNGMRVLVVERHKIPVVHVIWGVDTGASADPPGLAGANAMLAELLARAVEAGGETLEQRLRARGVVLDVDVNRDRAWYSMQLPREQLEWSLRVLRRGLVAPKFSETSHRLVRQQMNNAMTQAQADPERIRVLAEWLAAYGKDHPYGRPIGGNRASVDAIELQQLRDLHRARYRPEYTYLVVSGDVRAENLIPVLGNLLGGWKAAVPDSASLPAVASTPQRGVTLIDLPGSSQAQISVVSPISDDVPPLNPAASVMNTLLGGSAGSRLNRSLRGQHAYAYGASSQLEFRRQGGHMTARTTVSLADAADAVRQLVLEVERMRAEPAPDETERAGRYLENGVLALFETNRSIARIRARIESMGIDQDVLPAFLADIPEVQPSQIAFAARRCVSTEQISIVVVGDRQALETSLGQLGVEPVRVWRIDELWDSDRGGTSID